MEKIENELLAQLQDAHRRDDAGEIARIEAEMKVKAEGKLNGLKEGVRETKERVEVLKGNSSRKANGERRKLYKEFISLYREAKRLSDEISEIKKVMRVSQENEDGGEENAPGDGDS
jgi:hypothetical protein